ASVSVEILNMAEFCSVLTLTTGADGTASLTMGLGDVLVRAWKDGLCAEITVRAEEREISLKLTEAPENMPCGRTDLQIRAPKDGATPWPVPDAAQKAVGRTRLKAADAAREKRLSTFREDAARAAERYPGEADIFLRA